MNPEVLRQGKKALNVLWVVLALSFFIPAGGVASVLRAVFVLTLGAHVLEFLVFHRRLLSYGGTLGHHLVQVLLYGFFHIKLAELEAGGTQSA